MKWINKVKLFNFLSHKKTEINFTNGVNLIYGPSDSGKSSVLNALKWLLIDDNIKGIEREGEKKTFVQIEDESGSIFRRSKINGKQKFKTPFGTLNDFGRGIPEEIEKVLNIDDRNFQDQFDSHYLISSSGKPVDRELEYIFKLKKIDYYLTEIQRRIRRNNEKISILEGQYQKTVETEKKTKKILEIKNKVNEIKKREDEINELKINIQNLKIVNGLKTTIVEFNINKTLNLIDKIEEKQGKINEIEQEIYELKKNKKISLTIDELNVEVKQKEKILNKIRKSLNNKKEICKLCGARIENPSEYLQRICI